MKLKNTETVNNNDNVVTIKAPIRKSNSSFKTLTSPMSIVTKYLFFAFLFFPFYTTLF